MTPADLYRDHFSRILGAVTRLLADVADEALAWRPDPGSNTIAWLLWHVARIQDDHVADVAGIDQVWSRDGWAPRFGLPDGAMDTGYGHTAEQVAAVDPGSATVLVDYLSAVTDATSAFLDEVGADDLDRVVDESWDPPVTLGVRLDSVVGDNWQHVGQAALLHGQWTRTR